MTSFDAPQQHINLTKDNMPLPDLNDFVFADSHIAIHTSNVRTSHEYQIQRAHHELNLESGFSTLPQGTQRSMAEIHTFQLQRRAARKASTGPRKLPKVCHYTGSFFRSNEQSRPPYQELDELETDTDTFCEAVKRKRERAKEPVAKKVKAEPKPIYERTQPRVDVQAVIERAPEPKEGDRVAPYIPKRHYPSNPFLLTDETTNPWTEQINWFICRLNYGCCAWSEAPKGKKRKHEKPEIPKPGQAEKREANRIKELAASHPLDTPVEQVQGMARVHITNGFHESVGASSSSTLASSASTKSRPSSADEKKTTKRGKVSHVAKGANKLPVETPKELASETVGSEKPTSGSSRGSGTSSGTITSNGRILRIPRRFLD